MPDNTGSYYLAYAVATAIYAGYSAILIVRWKRVKARPAVDPPE